MSMWHFFFILFIISTLSFQTLFANLIASEINSLLVCKGKTVTVTPPSNFTLQLISSYIGISSNATCENISPQDCVSYRPVECTTTGRCTIVFPTNVLIPACGNKIADYIDFKYRFVPLYTQPRYAICDSQDIDATSPGYGMITSDYYPEWQRNKNCIRRITTVEGRRIRLYITDMSIELLTSGSCQIGYLEIDGYRYCGEKTSIQQQYALTSESNSIVLKYVSGTGSFLSDIYRGFNVYFEVIMDGKTTTTTTAPFTGLLTAGVLNNWGYNVSLIDRNIESIERDTFRSLSKLTSLNLLSNRLTEISIGIFRGLTNLEYLVLENNRIGWIDEGSFEDLVRVETVILSANNLTTVESEMFKGLRKVKELDLSHNHIKEIHSRVFVGLSSLESLRLNNNSVEYIDKFEFRNMRTLKRLDLGHNNLKYLDVNIVQGCVNLEILCLGGNQLAATFKLNTTGLLSFNHNSDQTEWCQSSSK